MGNLRSIDLETIFWLARTFNKKFYGFLKINKMQPLNCIDNIADIDSSHIKSK